MCRGAEAGEENIFWENPASYLIESAVYLVRPSPLTTPGHHAGASIAREGAPGMVTRARGIEASRFFGPRRRPRDGPAPVRPKRVPSQDRAHLTNACGQQPGNRTGHVLVQHRRARRIRADQHQRRQRSIQARRQDQRRRRERLAHPHLLGSRRDLRVLRRPFEHIHRHHTDGERLRMG